jgi:cation diffusion facilitator family transporter
VNGSSSTANRRAFAGAQGHVAGHDAFDATNPDRYKASRRVTLVSIGVNVLLAAAQMVIGWIGRSQGLVADGIHTLSDIITDAMVLLALKHGAKEADEEHPYGHGRIETAVTVALGALLIAVGIGIAVNAGLRLADLDSLQPPSLLTLWVAALTIVSKEGLYRYTVRTARRYRSNLLRANAWHHRSDAISSVIVLAGIGGSIAGLPYLDGLAAVGVAMMIAKIGGELSWNAVKELVDTALETDEVAEIRKVILEIDGVRSLHLLRTRRTGGRALVDVHIMVDGGITVSEGHHIGEKVRETLIDAVDSVTDVMVHIDPEDDELYPPSTGLPMRQEMVERLTRQLRAVRGAEEIDHVTLHYLRGKVHVELLLPLAKAGDEGYNADLQQRLEEAARRDPVVGSLRLAFH